MAVLLCRDSGFVPSIVQPSFLHKGLEHFYKTGKSSGIQAKRAKRLRLILTNLDQAECLNDMDLPGLRLHELTGSRKNIWSVSVSGNWRVTFRFIGRDAEIVNYPRILSWTRLSVRFQVQLIDVCWKKSVTC